LCIGLLAESSALSIGISGFIEGELVFLVGILVIDD